jgi:aminoglycoside phosphotransferase (APT) family kinase protein
MDFPDRMPADLRNFFENNYALLTGLEKLGGMSGSSVYRATFGNKLVILKNSRRPQESNFYKNIAPSLREQGVAIPEVYCQGEADGLYWLALESVPRPLPRERWGADPQVLEILGNLHRASLPPGPDLARLYHPAWNDAMTANAVTKLGLDSIRLAPVLRDWQEKAQSLFKPLGLISADPNPGNWGLRGDGSPVLFDWERFTFGSPAIDVSIITTGLPTKAALRHNAGRYLEVNPDVIDETLDDFAEDVKIAKVWSTVEFISMFMTQPDNGIPATTIEWLREEMPGWLESLVQEG